MPFVTSNNDALNATLQKLDRFKMTDLTAELQRYPMARMLLNKEHMEVQDGGDYIEFTLVTDGNEQAQSIVPGQVRTPNASSGTVKGRVDWRHLATDYSLIRQHTKMNQGESKILDYAKIERLRAMASWVERVDNLCWSVPASSSSADFNGIPYWIVESTTNTAGFNGGAPSGHTTVGNIDPATVTKFKNYTFEFSAITKADFIASVRTAIRKTGWVAPIQNPHKGPGRPSHGFYTCESNYLALETLGEAQNENLGRDVTKYQDNILLNGRPVVWCSQLDSHAVLASKTPFYGIDWATFSWVVLADEWNKETTINPMPYQPDTIVTYMDFTCNTLCRDRRRNFVATLAA